MADVTLTKVDFISESELNKLEKELTDLLVNFEKTHYVSTFAEVQIRKKI